VATVRISTQCGKTSGRLSTVIFKQKKLTSPRGRNSYKKLESEKMYVEFLI
jgi:hypothetical protein